MLSVFSWLIMHGEIIESALARESAAWADRLAPLHARRDSVQAVMAEDELRQRRLIELAGDNPTMGRAVASDIERLQHELETHRAELASIQADLDHARASQGAVADVMGILSVGVERLVQATPEDQKQVLQGLLAWVKLGVKNGEPMPIGLGLRIPLGPLEAEAEVNEGLAMKPVDDRSTGSQPSDSTGQITGGDEGTVEPVVCSTGSTGRFNWRRERDSNPRYDFTRTGH